MEKQRPKEPTPKQFFDIYIPNSIEGGYAHDLYITIDDLVSRSDTTPIRFKIDTYGGALNDCIQIARIMEQVPNPVITVAGTKCDSGGILLVACGDKGARYAPHNTEFIAHQVQWTIPQQKLSHPQLLKFVTERSRINRDFMDAIAAKSGVTRYEWLRATSEDYKFGSEEARDRWHIIDHIIPPKKHGK